MPPSPPFDLCPVHSCRARDGVAPGCRRKKGRRSDRLSLRGHTAKVKVFETKQAIADGAQEVDCHDEFGHVQAREYSCESLRWRGQQQPDAVALVEAGASRIGTKFGIDIVQWFALAWMG